MRMLNYATDNSNPFHQYQIHKRENISSGEGNVSPTLQRDSNPHFHTSPNRHDQTWMKRRIEDNASFSRDILDSRSATVDFSNSSSGNRKRSTTCMTRKKIPVDRNEFTSLYHDDLLKDRPSCFASIEDMDFLDASYASELSSDLSCSSSFYECDDLYMYKCSELENDTISLSNPKGINPMTKENVQITGIELADQCDFPRDQKFSKHQEDVESSTMQYRDDVTYDHSFMLGCHATKGKFSGMTLADTLARRRKISDRRNNTRALISINNKSRNSYSTLIDAAENYSVAKSDCSGMAFESSLPCSTSDQMSSTFGQKNKNDCNEHHIQRSTILPSSAKSMSFLPDLPDKSNTMYLKEAARISSHDRSGDVIDMKRPRKEHSKMHIGANTSKIDAAMKIRKLLEAAKKKHVPVTTSPERAADDFMIVRARLKKANYNFRSKIPQDCEAKDSSVFSSIRPQTISAPFDSDVGDPEGLSIKIKQEISRVEGVVPQERKLNDREQQHDLHRIQSKLSNASRSSTKDGYINDIKMIVPNEAVASPTPSDNSTSIIKRVSNSEFNTACQPPIKSIDKIISPGIVIEANDSLPKSKRHGTYPNATEQYQCFNPVVSSSMRDVSMSQDAGFVDLDPFISQDVSTTNDERSKCAEYDPRWEISTILDTNSSQSSRDSSSLLSVVLSKNQEKNVRKANLFQLCDSINAVEETRGEEESAIQLSGSQRPESLPEPIEKRDDAPSFITCGELEKEPMNRHCTSEESTFHLDRVMNAKKDIVGLLQESQTLPAGKYAQMVKVGIPKEAIAHAMIHDGVLVQEHSKGVGLDKQKDHAREVVESARNVKTNMSLLKEDHDYSKYTKMLKMGLPRGAVENAMKRDGEDPSILFSINNDDANHKCQETPFLKKVDKDMYRRTRLHWVEVQSAQNSVWDSVKNDDDVSQLKIDEEEFSALFQLKRQMNGSINRVKEVSPEKVVKVIDSKRANNGGIILARLKMSYDDIAKAIEAMDERYFNAEQIKGIMEYIPTAEEMMALQRYMRSFRSIECGQLCECEKFMVSIIPVVDAKRKMQCMLFKLTFPPSINELQIGMGIVMKACNELLGSLNLRKVLGIILKVGNRLNSSGTENEKYCVDGFTIDTLSKLNHIKAFDRKTTVLLYVVSLIQRSNESLLYIKQDIPHVFEAQKINVDYAITLAALSSQLDDVKKTALEEAHKVVSNCLDAGSDEEEITLLKSCRVGVFSLQATAELSSLQKINNEVRISFSRVLEYFAQEEEIKQSMLFRIVGNFSQEVDIVLDELTSKKVVKKRFRLNQTERKRLQNE